MSCDGWNRAARVAALAVLVLAVAACGGSKEEEAAAEKAAVEAAAAAAGPDEATKNAAIRDAEQRLGALRTKADELRRRAELDGVDDDGSVQQGIAALDRQIADAQSKIASMKSASGEGWSGAESATTSALASADSAANQLQSQINTVRTARRVEAIEAEQAMLAMGLVMGLDGEEYEAYKKAVVVTAQEQLTTMGLYAGPADGWLEASTKRALAALQAQHGLGGSGVPTPKTRRVLRGESPFEEEDS